MGRTAKIRQRRRRRKEAFYQRCFQALTRESAPNVTPATESWEEKLVRELREIEDAHALAILEAISGA